ncbi:MAG TPA: MarR family transcriptional regulator [Mycobacteriales bacterium]|jgi:DNA-binding MarR family transcriptional regulator|nr:MarR family transcriptional regulator [Mycobacteriales bacterium]
MSAEAVDDSHEFDETSIAIASELGRGLSQLLRSASRAKTRMIACEPGIEWSTFVILVPLMENGPLRSSALAEAVHLDPSRVSRMISHVIEIGLVQRQADPADGRAAILQITARGKHVFGQLQRQRDEYLASVVSAWTESDRRTFAILMGRFASDFSDALHQTDSTPNDNPPQSKLEHA